jgi:hypothetical protein
LILICIIFKFLGYNVDGVIVMNDNNQIKVGLAKVTASGLLFNNLLYSNASMIKYQWFEHARINGVWQIPVLYQSSYPNQIVLFDFKEMEIATTIEIDQKTDPVILKCYYEAFNNLKEMLKSYKE